ncbi:hypothetical protein [Acaryochloris sp. CCMEE 5410]|uniref:hypothetical protein n=1 Tax=Acaryochloris sp. CCMEE 5410 TaxID=310037 RepID=UPI0002483D06|nr:hypothetical protein [Acaryochloris sp. CCMEE 5410]KAI9129439.1 hypothetical protein ON05_035620 [Acaryochloris sp. CCMEE 5410]
MATLRKEITEIITRNTPERAALEILVLLEDKGLSLIKNGWLDDDEGVIPHLESIAEDWVHPRFGDIPVGTFFIHEGINRKVSETEARKVDFQEPETFIDDGPTEIGLDVRVYPAEGLI